MITVDEIMNTHVVTITAEETIQSARMLMNENNIRHIPVVNEENKLCGLITQRDVLKADSSTFSVSGQQHLKSHNVEDIMTAQVVTVHPKDSLRAAGIKLQKNKYGCLPVVDSGKVQGIITDSDFVGVAIDLIEQLDSVEEEMSDPDFI